MATSIQETTNDTGSQDVTAGSDRLLTADEVATFLRVTPAWVYSETRHHRIPHLRLGRYVRFRQSALDAWMEEVERSSDRARPPRRR
jgi:excisionase family DNA binding protein